MGLVTSRISIDSPSGWNFMNTDPFHRHLRRLSLADPRVSGEGESFRTWNARILGKAGASVYVALGGAGSKMFSGISSLLSSPYQCRSPVSSSRECQALEEQGTRVPLLTCFHFGLGGRMAGSGDLRVRST